MSALGLIPDPSEQLGRGLGPKGAKMRHQAKFLAAFSVCGSVARASRWAKVARTSHYEWMQMDPEYPRRFEEAEMRAGRALEDEAVRRAFEGLRKPMFYQGKVVRVNGEIVYEVEYSDRLLERLLEANNPEKFKRRTENSQVWDLDPSKLSEQQLAVLAEHFLKDIVGNDPQQLEQARRELESGNVVINATSERVEDEPASTPSNESIDERKTEDWEP